MKISKISVEWEGEEVALLTFSYDSLRAQEGQVEYKGQLAEVIRRFVESPTFDVGTLRTEWGSIREPEPRNWLWVRHAVFMLLEAYYYDQVDFKVDDMKIIDPPSHEDLGSKFDLGPLMT